MRTGTGGQGQSGRPGRRRAEGRQGPWHRGARCIAPLALAALAVLAIDTSCTAPLNCPSGQHAQRAPSRQGHMWECAPGTR